MIIKLYLFRNSNFMSLSDFQYQRVLITFSFERFTNSSERILYSSERIFYSSEQTCYLLERYFICQNDLLIRPKESFFFERFFYSFERFTNSSEEICYLFERIFYLFERFTNSSERIFFYLREREGERETSSFHPLIFAIFT